MLCVCVFFVSCFVRFKIFSCCWRSAYVAGSGSECASCAATQITRKSTEKNGNISLRLPQSKQQKHIHFSRNWTEAIAHAAPSPSPAYYPSLSPSPSSGCCFLIPFLLKFFFAATYSRHASEISPPVQVTMADELPSFLRRNFGGKTQYFPTI